MSFVLFRGLPTPPVLALVGRLSTLCQHSFRGSAGEYTVARLATAAHRQSGPLRWRSGLPGICRFLGVRPLASPVGSARRRAIDGIDLLYVVVANRGRDAESHLGLAVSIGDCKVLHRDHVHPDQHITRRAQFGEGDVQAPNAHPVRELEVDHAHGTQPLAVGAVHHRHRDRLNPQLINDLLGDARQIQMHRCPIPRRSRR